MAAVIEMQQALAAHAWPAGERVRVRMGVHTGEASKTAAGPGGPRRPPRRPGGRGRARRPGPALGDGGGAGARLASGRRGAAGPRPAPAEGPGPPGADLPAPRGGPARPSSRRCARWTTRRCRTTSRPSWPASSAVTGSWPRSGPWSRSSRLVTLTGAGGSGKTRLSLQVAAELLDGSGDGVWLVELAAVADQDAVAPAICRALGMPGGRAGPSWRPCSTPWRPQDVLIVLDNCEHLIGACAKIADAILRRCPRVHLLATSREPLGIGGETIYRVPSLSLPGPGDGRPGGGRVLRRGRAVRRPGPGAGRRPARRRADGPAGGVDLPPAGRHAAGHRAGRRPAALAVAQRPARPPGPAVPPAHRGQPHRPAAPADAAGDGRLVLLAAHRRRAAAAAAPVGVRRGLRPGRGRSGVRLRRHRGVRRHRPARLAGGQEPGRGRASRGETLRYRLLETIRQFAAERLAEAGAGRGRRGRSGPLRALPVASPRRRPRT